MTDHICPDCGRPMQQLWVGGTYEWHCDFNADAHALCAEVERLKEELFNLRNTPCKGCGL